ncbi:adenylate kinase [Anaeromicropila herbilytica]|uniref:Adenylate kinase n=1 Tax=Anaeromicropila herbilytica TaxID=2785025 RepID=A0A7R7EL64_9FIRM|nr:adenylate kinase [Anaeromicropila herbilytica]BCN30819.1 adenylate kinase [Anaeromicropila herbilytica]
MIILIGGSTHTGKTALSQRLIEKYHYPCMSLDHLKMGLIRSGHTSLTAEDDDKMTDLLWPIVKEMIKSAIENDQNMIIEGCYFPYDWREYFEPDYLKNIRMVFLVMSPKYIEEHFKDIKNYASIVENRGDDSYCKKELLLRDNQICFEMCKKHGCEYILIDNEYSVDINI